MAAHSLQEQLAAALQLGMHGLLQAYPGQLQGQASGTYAVTGAQPGHGARPGAEPESSEDLITPTNDEAGQQQQQLLQLQQVQPAAAAFAALPPPPPQQCLLCGGLGSSASCGPLRPATFDGQPVAVHHLCAIWCPGCFQREGSSVYINLEEEVRRARKRTCNACGRAGASLPCSHPGCRASYHLPCAQGAPAVVLERDAFEVWCPTHADLDEGASDEDYSLAAPRPRRTAGGGISGTKRPRTTSDVQRPRTDWQKRDDTTWLKVVPPWWCEQRTVHFASKVYKELFRSAASTVLVDPQGGEWACVVQSEARNDLRPQYTLRGAFAELWEAQGICAGDTLIFKRDLTSGHISLNRHAAGSGAAAAARMEEQGTGSELSGPSAVEGSGGRGARAAAREASSDQTRGASQQGSHPNRWLELADGWSIKTVYKSTLQHQQCPIAGWLFKKLYGRLPAENDRAHMYDPDLDAEYRFDVHFISAANVHYMTGRTFSCWVKESGLQAGEQIRIKREGPRVHIQRVPLDRKVHIAYGGKGASRSVSLSEAVATAAVAGAPAAHGQELASPPPPDALEAMEALVAAAGFAGTHGTPAIQAALAGAAGAAAAAAAMAAGGLPGADALVPHAKRHRMGQDEAGDAADVLLAQQEQQVLLARRAGGAAPAGLGWPGALAPAPPAAPASLDSWQPSSTHTLMLRAINEVLARHEWSAEEAAACLRFRAKYAWLDACGREVAYEEVRRLSTDKPALLLFVKAVAEGILMPLPPAGTPAAAAATATPAGAGLPPMASPHAMALHTTSPGMAAAPLASPRMAAVPSASPRMAAAANASPCPVAVPAASPRACPAASHLPAAPAAAVGAPQAASLPPPQLPEGGGLHLPAAPPGLDVDGSVSLDLLLGGSHHHDEHDTPSGLAALGML